MIVYGDNLSAKLDQSVLGRRSNEKELHDLLPSFCVYGEVGEFLTLTCKLSNYLLNSTLNVFGICEKGQFYFFFCTDG